MKLVRKIMVAGIVCLTFSQTSNAQFRLKHRYKHCTTTTYQQANLHYQTPTQKFDYNVSTLQTSTEREGDGLAEVNARRARSGLRPFLPDPLLTQAARNAASYRALRGLFGHTPNDFAFIPSGGQARSAGCAAYGDSMGWMSCCVEENATYAGAYWVRGADGRRFMHLYVR